VVPIQTVADGRVGPQPHDTPTQRCRPTGVLPAGGLFLAAAIVGSLLAWGRAAPARAALAAAHIVAVAVDTLTPASVAAFHLVGVLTLPLGAALLAAAFAPGRTVDAP
jgi:hypothetical protein